MFVEQLGILALVTEHAGSQSGHSPTCSRCCCRPAALCGWQTLTHPSRSSARPQAAPSILYGQPARGDAQLRWRPTSSRPLLPCFHVHSSDLRDATIPLPILSQDQRTPMRDGARLLGRAASPAGRPACHAAQWRRRQTRVRECCCLTYVPSLSPSLGSAEHQSGTVHIRRPAHNLAVIRGCEWCWGGGVGSKG